MFSEFSTRERRGGCCAQTPKAFALFCSWKTCVPQSSHHWAFFCLDPTFSSSVPAGVWLMQQRVNNAAPAWNVRLWSRCIKRGRWKVAPPHASHCFQDFGYFWTASLWTSCGAIRPRNYIQDHQNRWKLADFFLIRNGGDKLTKTWLGEV